MAGYPGAAATLRLFDRAKNAVVGAATTDIAIERLRDFGARGRRIPIKQRLGGYENAAEAITALAGLLVEKSLLQWVRRIAGPEAFHGDDGFALHAPDWLRARFLGCTIDQDRAAATLLEAATKARTDETQLVAQHRKQRFVFMCDCDLRQAAVQSEIELPGHRFASTPRERHQGGPGRHHPSASVHLHRYAFVGGQSA